MCSCYLSLSHSYFLWRDRREDLFKKKKRREDLFVSEKSASLCQRITLSPGKKLFFFSLNKIGASERIIKSLSSCSSSYFRLSSHFQLYFFHFRKRAKIINYSAAYPIRCFGFIIHLIYLRFCKRE